LGTTSRMTLFKLALHAILLGCLTCVSPLGAQTTSVLSGTFSASGTQTGCGSSNTSSPFSLSGTVIVTLQPALSSLVSAGGQVTGNIVIYVTQDDCGNDKNGGAQGSVTGVVSPGGQTNLTITLPDVAQNGCSFTGTGTPSEIKGAIPSSCFDQGTVASGGFDVTSQPVTVLSGPYSISGTQTDTGCSGAYSESGTVTFILQPSLASLAAAGGQTAGTLFISGIGGSCGNTKAVGGSAAITGAVAAGGQTTLTIAVAGDTNSGGGPGCSLPATGTPSEVSGTFPQACFGNGEIATGTFTAFSQNPGAPSIPPALLSSATVLTAGSQTIPAAGGTPPYTFTLVGGTLPPGIVLGSTGTLSGTPTTAGSYTFTVKVTDTTGASAVGTFTLTVAPPALTVTTPSPLPSGMVTVQYPQQVLAASGGNAPYTFSVPANSLPAGLTLTPGGAISGTPSVTGAFPFTLTVTDSSVPTLMSAAALSLTIRPLTADLITSAGSLSFSLAAGAVALPPSDTVQVESTDVTQILSWSTTITPAVPWLTVSAGGTTPGAFTVALTAGAETLAPSTYNTTISVKCLAPSPCAGNAQPVTVSLLVSGVAPQLTAVTNLLSFTTSSANPQTTTLGLTVQNSGGGTLTITSVTCGQPFCVAAPAPGPLGGGAAATINIQANPAGLSPGYYVTAVTIVSSAGTVTVPVTFYIATGSSLMLNPAGIQLAMPAGGVAADPVTSFLVDVSGGASATSAVAFTAAVLPGAPWLNLATTSGSSTGNTPGAVSFSINQTAAAALTPQVYYGTIRVTSAGAVNSPQDFQVVLNVGAANAPQTAKPFPAGMIFISSGSTPPPQVDQVFASSAAPVPYQASASTTSGGSWLLVNPATGTTSASSPAQTSVSVNPAGLASGVYHGSVSYSLAAAAVPTVNVTLVVKPGAGALLRTGQLDPHATACTPTQIVPTQTGLVNDFTAPASWPTPLEIQLSDDCGSAVTNGQIVATFSNGDPPLALGPENSTAGLYAGTWTPRTPGSQVVVTARATAPGFPAATAPISGAVAPNVAPILYANGTLNAFAIAAEPGVPIAPGSIVQIYGSGLAGQTMSGGTIPLQTSLGGTSVIVGGILAPLYYVSAGQLNAQIPFELTPGQPAELIVSANGALTTPQTIQLAAVSPGIAEYPSGYAIAQHGADASLITDASPAKPGEYIVLYLAGMGPTTIPVASGAASPSSPTANTIDAPTITLNSEAVSIISFSGLTPTAAGLYQIDLQIPADAPNGDLTLVVNQPGFNGTPVILPVHN
jgi:uncharacterized protein (TIGR03437 family)